MKKVDQPTWSIKQFLNHLHHNQFTCKKRKNPIKGVTLKPLFDVSQLPLNPIKTHYVSVNSTPTTATDRVIPSIAMIYCGV